MDGWGEERREAARRRLSLAAAGAVHALGLLVLAIRPPSVAPPRVAPYDEETIALEIVPEVAVTARESPAPPEPPLQPAPGTAALPASSLVVARVASGAVPSDDPYGEGAAALQGHGPGAGAPASADAVGSASANPPRDRALPPPLRPLAVQAPMAALGGPLGVAPAAGSEVMVAVRSAAERSGPAQGHGVARITVEEDGTVSAVTVSGVGWEAAGQGMRTALVGRKLRVPKGARGVVVALSLDAQVTRVPPVLTGEARARAMAPDTALGGADDNHGSMKDNHGGMFPGAPNMAVIDPTLLLPLKRWTVKVELVSEQGR
jgi:hypothetical protein